MNPTVALIEPEVQELLRAGGYAELREVLHGLPPADVADILAGLSPEEEAIAFRVLQRDDAATVFSYLEPGKQEELIKRLGDAGAVRIVEAMEVDDRARLLDELPPEVAQRIVASLSAEDRRSTQAILGYPARSVGRLMTPDYVRIRPEWTVARALEHIRRYGRDAETINVVYVADDQGALIDDMRLRQLIMAEPDATVESLMNRQFITLRADQPQEEAVEALQKYDRVALPVVDSRGALLGIVTHDDLADVAQELATEQIQNLGAVQALEDPFIQSSVLDLFRKRAPWLALLFLSELLTSNAIALFQGEIERAAILAIFIPAIISSGGNAGSQASTLVIRALGLKEIGLADWWRVLRRELIVAAILGLLIGCIGVIRINLFGLMGWFSDPGVIEHFVILGWTIGLTLVGVVIWGSIMGAMLPFVLKRLGFDPAGSSTPFVATLVDVTGIVIYFTVALLMLKSTLLSDRAADSLLGAQIDVVVVDAEPLHPRARDAILLVRESPASPSDTDSAPRRVAVPISALPGGLLPPVGTRLRLTTRIHDADAVTLLDPAPPPSPTPPSTPPPGGSP